MKKVNKSKGEEIYTSNTQKTTRAQDTNSLEEPVPSQVLHSQIDLVVELSQDDFLPTSHELIM